jgi:polyisoprenyl-teichoic acid--peptidoglycan teichoic acid transferase
MEKTSSGYEPQNWRRQQPMARRTKYNREWLDNPTRPRSGGVLYARRRKDQFTTAATLIVIGMIGIGLLGLIWTGVLSMRNAVARHNSPKTAKLAQENATAIPAIAAGKKKEKTNILLLGSDKRPDDGSFRTDVILLVSIDPENKTVSAVSFPRDLWVEPEGMDGMKINMVQGLGGFEATANMFETSFGVKPKYFVLTNFDGFTGIVDKLGGIDVEVGQSLTDDCDLPQQVDGDCTVDPGTVHMDGPTALWYVRSRHTSSDYDRMRRMQEVITSVFNRLMSLNALSKIGELYQEFSGSVETNLRVKDILPLVPVASEVFGNRDKIKGYAIGSEYGTEMISWNGMWILLPDLEKIKGLLQEAGME